MFFSTYRHGIIRVDMTSDTKKFLRCKHCGSMTDLTLMELNEAAARKRSWICGKCGGKIQILDQREIGDPMRVVRKPKSITEL